MMNVEHVGCRSFELDATGSTSVPAADSCTYGNESCCSTKRVEFLDQLKDKQSKTENSAV